MNAKNPKDYEILTKTVAETYRSCRRRSSFYEDTGCVREHRKEYDADVAFTRYVDLTLESCSDATRLIIRRAYLDNGSAAFRYTDYFSSSTYYRLRRRAMVEFVEALE